MSLYVQGRIINFMVVELCAEYKISYANVFSQRFVKNTRKTDDAKLVFDPLGRPGKLGSTENFCNFGKVKEGHCVIVTVIMMLAMFIFYFCLKQQDKHCIKHYDCDYDCDYDKKIRYKYGP